LEDLRECSVFIIAVPTPIDEFKAPDLTPLIKASETVGQVLKAGDLVTEDGFQIRPRFASFIRVAEAACRSNPAWWAGTVLR
jgi:UDP-N-acetyl-D-galactosamine dehydrogenase